MKDHELRELINDVTAVAQIYAHTQQLREQIAHLIIPAFSKLECEKEMRRGMNEGKDIIIENREDQITRQLTEIENLNRQLDFEAKQRTELRKDLKVAKGQFQGACGIIKNLESESRLGHSLFADQVIRADKLEAEITRLKAARSE